MDGGAILAIILIIGILVLSTIGLTFLIGGADTLKSKERLTPSLEIRIENGVSDTTFIYTKQQK